MNNVETLEKILAGYAGSVFSVAMNTCTDAIYTALTYLKDCGKIKNADIIVIPNQTYHQVPLAIRRAGLLPVYEDIMWWGEYELKPTCVIDGSLRFQKGMYKPDTLLCISFNYRKPLPIGKGGMIFTDNFEACNWMKKFRYLNYMYMTEESAARGISLFDGKINPKHGYVDYEKLSDNPNL